MTPKERELVDDWLKYLERQAKQAKLELLVWRIETAATQGVPDLWVCVDGVPVWLECKRFVKHQEITYQPNQKKNLFFLKQQCHKCATLVIDGYLCSWFLPPPQTAIEVGSKVCGTDLRKNKCYEATEALYGLLTVAYGDKNKAKERLKMWGMKAE